ncbi:PH domain-containing protein [Brooklawnia cerclae]|uniref:Membrane protein YdbS with pleckstrin-like domain n=1 Tax=Brooklawnia cerclae TaxID=349934 RepID=A0ABX0SC51_9ACTN|nr:membrane protein YdbS with pleckstrin-like domain [Brooklawnia cerclae]
MATRLSPDEDLVITTRPHARVLIGPVVALLVVSAVVGWGLAAVPEDWRPVGQYAVAGAGALAAVMLVVRPLVRWATTTTTLTTRRIVTRWGLVRRGGHDLPLNRVVDVTHTRGAGDLVFGSGTLVLTTMGGERVALRNLPHIRDMRHAVSELVADESPWDAPGELPWH